MRIGTLVYHENYFGVGVVTHFRKVNGSTEWKTLWLREGRDFGWSRFEKGGSVEILCK
jgi:hypothetical protein